MVPVCRNNILKAIKQRETFLRQVFEIVEQ